MTTELEDPAGYGRIVRDSEGQIERIVEVKGGGAAAGGAQGGEAPHGDATPAELAIREVNTGTYAFDASRLIDALDHVTNDNAQGEYYLGDVLPPLREAGGRIAVYRAPDQAVNLGVNTRVDLAVANREARRRILNSHMLAGVTVIDPDATWVDADVQIEPDATIEPGCTLRGASRVGQGAVVGPFTTLIDTVLGSGAAARYSYLVECEVLERCTVGPFTYIRPRTTLREGAKAGAFVEIKGSEIGPGTKIPHLSYVGDAEVGEDANIGAGSITANWDGFRKHRTVIGDHVRIGVDTSLVAPVHVGDAAYTGAGSVITRDVPGGALGISRSEQQNVEGYAERTAREASRREGEEAKQGEKET
jgi:bifunctional UDP-N-acetylglucosamine pyrophosphorylase/glucosamine-1-phosphate N-acetyltransferase